MSRNNSQPHDFCSLGVPSTHGHSQCGLHRLPRHVSDAHPLAEESSRVGCATQCLVIYHDFTRDPRVASAADDDSHFRGPYVQGRGKTGVRDYASMNE